MTRLNQPQSTTTTPGAPVRTGRVHEPHDVAGEPTHHPVGRNGRSLPQLLRELRDEAATLVQQELKLAKTEIAEEVESAKSAVVSSLAGAVLLAVGVFTLALAASAGLYAALVAAEMDHMLAGWLSPLIVGTTLAIIGEVMLSRMKKVTKAEHWRPRRTEQSLRETKRWAERKL